MLNIIKHNAYSFRLQSIKHSVVQTYMSFLTLSHFFFYQFSSWIKIWVIKIA